MSTIDLKKYNNRLSKSNNSNSNTQDDFINRETPKTTIQDDKSPNPLTPSDDAFPHTPPQIEPNPPTIPEPKPVQSEPAPVEIQTPPHVPTHPISDLSNHSTDEKMKVISSIQKVLEQHGITLQEIFEVKRLNDPTSIRVHHSASQDAFGSSSLISHSGRIDTVRQENDQTIAKRVDHISQFGNLKIVNRTGVGNVALPIPVQASRTLSSDETIYSEKQYSIRVSRLDPRQREFKPAFIQKAMRANFLMTEYTDYIQVHRAIDTGTCTQKSEELFAMDTYYVIAVPNPEMFSSPLVQFAFDYVPETKQSMFNIYIPDAEEPQHGLHKGKIASGLIIAGLNFAVNSNQILHLHGNEVIFGTEGMDNFPLNAFRNRKGLKIVEPLFCLLPQSTSLIYLRPLLLECEGLFRYGREANLVVNRNYDAALVSTYINTDFVSAKASNISIQRFVNFREVRQRLALGLEAYGFSNSQIDVHQLIEDEVRFGHLPTSAQKLSSFLVTAALTDSLYDVILEANINAFTAWGTVVPNHVSPAFNVLPTSSPDRIVSEIMNVAYAESTYEEAIIELVKQVTVPLRWASFTPIRYKQRDIMCYYKLLEIMLAFQFYPQRCKEAGAGLSTTLYSLFEVLWPEDFGRFIENYGMANLQPNDDIPVDDRDYWNNSRIPSLYLRIAEDNLAQNNPIDQVLRLIRPVTEPIPHAAAERAGFPRVLVQTVSYCPYSLAHESGIDSTPFKRRILDITRFMRAKIDEFSGPVSMSKPTRATHCAFFSNLEAAIGNHGLGFGRNIRVPLYHLINRQTMVMDYYDGRLGTPFPKHLCLTSSEDPTEQPLQRVISLEPEGCTFRTQTVWQLIYGLVFPELTEGTRGRVTTNPCLFVPPEPGLGYSLDEEIFQKCQAVTTPLGIATSLIANQRNSPGIRVINQLLGNVRYRKSDFISVYRVIQDMVNTDSKLSDFFSIGSVKDALGLRNTIDLRVPDLALRELDVLDIPINPDENSPACVREPLQLVEETFFDRFVLGVDALASPDSAYSSIRTGIIIHLVNATHLSPYTFTPDCDWPHEVGFSENAHCQPVFNEGIRSVIYHDNDIPYTEAKDYPYRRFTLTNLDLLSAKAIGFLTSGAVAGRFRIELPNVIYTKAIKPLEKYSPDYQSQCIASLLSRCDIRVPHICFYDTQVSTYTVQLQHDRVPTLPRYFWPYGSITDNVIVRGLCGESQNPPEVFIPPQDTVYSSGRMGPNGEITYDNTLPKDLRSLSFTNPVYGVTDKADFSGMITYSYRPSRILT